MSVHESQTEPARRAVRFAPVARVGLAVATLALAALGVSRVAATEGRPGPGEALDETIAARRARVESFVWERASVHHDRDCDAREVRQNAVARGRALLGVGPSVSPSKLGDEVYRAKLEPLAAVVLETSRCARVSMGPVDDDEEMPREDLPLLDAMLRGAVRGVRAEGGRACLDRVAQVLRVVADSSFGPRGDRRSWSVTERDVPAASVALACARNAEMDDLRRFDASVVSLVADQPPAAAPARADLLLLAAQQMARTRDERPAFLWWHPLDSYGARRDWARVEWIRAEYRADAAAALAVERNLEPSGGAPEPVATEALLTLPEAASDHAMRVVRNVAWASALRRAVELVADATLAAEPLVDPFGQPIEVEDRSDASMRVIAGREPHWLYPDDVGEAFVAISIPPPGEEDANPPPPWGGPHRVHW